MFLLYSNDLPYAVARDFSLYTDDTCIVFQHKSVIEIEKQLIRDLSNMCDWFVDGKYTWDKTKQSQHHLVLNINFELLSL